MSEETYAKHGMRRKDRAISDPQLLEKILRHGVTCRLAFNDAQAGCPYIVPLTYGYDNGRLIFHAAKQGRKIDLIRQGGQVAFEVDLQSPVLTGENACDWTLRFASIIGWGEVRLIEDEADRVAALQALMNHHGFAGDADFNPPDFRRTAVFALQVREMTGKSNNLDWLAEQLQGRGAATLP